VIVLKINDHYGHQGGGETLRRITAEIQICCWLSDSFGRYGGEEFLPICPQMDKAMAFHFARRIREQVEALSLDDT
jgi:polar amino acid transport system substrate-binding protein